MGEVRLRAVLDLLICVIYQLTSTIQKGKLI